MRYSIVIPTLNERENITLLLERLDSGALHDYEVIVVDENSPDGTLDAVRAYAENHPHVRGVANPGPRGLSPSIVHGFSLAQGEILCCMDGDLQHSVDDLAGLLSTADSNDFVIGSRYAPGGGFAEKWNFFRVFISRTATWMAYCVLGVRARDPMSGFFAVRREAFAAVRPHMSPRGFKIMLEMLFRLRHTPGNWRIAEYGITFGLRQHGKSKLSGRVIWQYLAMLYSLRFHKQA